MAAWVVSKAKLNHPEIILTMLLPYHPAESPIELPSYFDGSLYPFEGERIPKRAAIIRANRFMILHSDYLIAYVVHEVSNAKKLLKYAKSLKSAKITELNTMES